MKIALDTNFLLYFGGFDDQARHERAQDTLALLADHDLILPVQVIGELWAVLQRKTRLPKSAIFEQIQLWQEVWQCAPTNWETMQLAMALASSHHLSSWDAVIFAAAAQAGCQIFLSEDMQHGFTWHGVTLINPFLPAGLDDLTNHLADLSGA